MRPSLRKNYWNFVKMCPGNLPEICLVGFVDTLKLCVLSLLRLCGCSFIFHRESLQVILWSCWPQIHVHIGGTCVSRCHVSSVEWFGRSVCTKIVFDE